MSKLTIAVPAELKVILDPHPEINRDRVAEKALWSDARKVQLADQIASRSVLTEAAAEALGRRVKGRWGLRKR